MSLDVTEKVLFNDVVRVNGGAKVFVELFIVYNMLCALSLLLLSTNSHFKICHYLSNWC